MAVLGVIILILVAVVAVTVVSQGGEAVALELPGFDIDTTAAGVFGVGAASLLLGVLGVILLVGGARRGRRRRKEVHNLRREVDRQPRAAGGPPPDGPTGETSDRDRREHTRPRPGRGGDEGDGEHFSTAPRD